jgi:hypothetical protein
MGHAARLPCGGTRALRRLGGAKRGGPQGEPQPRSAHSIAARSNALISSAPGLVLSASAQRSGEFPPAVSARNAPAGLRAKRISTTAEDAE